MSIRLFVSSLPLVAFLLAPACGDDPKPSPTADTASTSDTSDTQDATSAPDGDATSSSDGTTPPGCAPLTLSGTLARTDGVGAFKLGGDRDLGLGGPLPDAVVFEFNTDQTGTFDLGSGDNSNYASCDQCIRIVQDIDPNRATQPKTLFQKSGSITIASATPPNGYTIHLTLKDVRFTEVQIRASDYLSIEVAGGVCAAAGGTQVLETAPCVPSCGDHICGPDGCGGQCGGGCTGGKRCALDGLSCIDSTACTPLTLSGEPTNPETGVFRVPVATRQLGAYGVADFAQLEFYKDNTGVFTLSGGVNRNYASCLQCVRLVVDGRTEFFQRAGTLTVDRTSNLHGAPGEEGFMDATLEGVILEEVTLSPVDSTSTPVVQGACVAIEHIRLKSATSTP